MLNTTKAICRKRMPGTVTCCVEATGFARLTCHSGRPSGVAESVCMAQSGRTKTCSRSPIVCSPCRRLACTLEPLSACQQNGHVLESGLDRTTSDLVTPSPQLASKVAEQLMRQLCMTHSPLRGSFKSWPAVLASSAAPMAGHRLRLSCVAFLSTE